jgi:hypothetical protein
MEMNRNDLLEALKILPDRLRALLADTPEHVLLCAPEGAWSAKVHVGHLLAMESLWIARFDDFKSGNTLLRPFKEDQSDTLQGRFDEQDLSGVLSDFEQIRKVHIALIEQLDEVFFLRKSKDIQGTEISFDEHLRMMQTHDERHFQIIAQRIAHAS